MIQNKSSTIEAFMRWRKDRGVFEFKPSEDWTPPLEFPEGKVTEILQSLEGDLERHKILKFLFDEARKDPSGNWVSVSSVPAEPGQGMV